ncbi:hypothetical protein GOP47_0021208 [Adiantum capillus-veneris]|uniref:non-specific serine/threonine protein kinase n=1 Tax=Adiantum capillus-veneris TaxID=13818 RepID=A0A9D4Z6W1_ADICA|nr:hypothetical protein GOP47_0021208 [Adiantum capillus-veneris]
MGLSKVHSHFFHPDGRRRLVSSIALLIFITLSFACSASSAMVFKPQDEHRIACGEANNVTDGQGRVWVGDGGGTAASFLSLNSGKDTSASTTIQDVNIPDVIPFSKARIFTSPATYSFPVSPGRHSVRLYFYPFAFSTFAPADAIVSVHVDAYILMSNVSLSDLMYADNLAYVFKEFSVNTTEDFFTLSFIPGMANNAYAMVNGIEILSMPDNLYESSLNAVGLGEIIPFPLRGTAMETLYRLNVGGQTVVEGKDDLGRLWQTDLAYTIGAVQGVSASAEDPVSYGNLDNYTAPIDVYNSARFMSNDNGINLQFNLTWNFSVDTNFTYYLRLHFCEFQYDKPNMRVFDIYVNDALAMGAYDVVAAAGDELIANVLDFSLTLQGADLPSISVQLHPNNSTNSSFYNAILNGIEIFKMNDTAGNLQGPPPPIMIPAPASKSSAGSGSTGTNKMAMVGGVIGSIVALTAIIAGFVCFRRRRQQKSRKGGRSGRTTSSWLPLPTHSRTGISQSMVSKLSSASRKSATSSYVSSAPSNNCRYFSFSEIVDMTNNFNEDNVIGVGGFGKVYKGVCDDGTTIAVKRGNPTSEQGITEFQTEIELLSKLRHRHLVSLIGFCEDHNEMILVYDYMSNGPLRGHLYGAGLPPLSWKQRLDICIGSARGLHYLHTGAAHGIIHRDVKTTNILLDENFVAKVSDFGLSKTGPSLDHTHVSTAVKGSFGYLDPEYFRRQQLTEKSDVYSFGVVLLEALCARSAINPTLPRDQVNMAEWAMNHQKKGMLEQIIDPYLVGKISKESLKKFGETAEKCLAESGLDRPTMGDVLWNLEYALQLHEASTERDLDVSNPKVKEVELPDLGGKMMEVGHESPTVSEDSDDPSASAIFSQLVNGQGR